MNTILIAEDEPEVRNYLRVALTCRGYGVEFAQNGAEALQYLRGGCDNFSLLLLDILMPQKDGMETLREVHDMYPGLPVIMLSGASSPANIVMAMRLGAKDFLPKPVGHEELCKAIEKAVPPLTNVQRFSPHPAEHALTMPAIGAWSQKVDRLLHDIGSSDVPVLLQGETGVGKEVLARKLHTQSPRADHLFLKLNCAALPAELVESELFGYERGAFTGAFKNTTGKFQMVDGGTLLLDEIGDMDFKLQAKLLHVLQDREFLRLGAKEVSKVDVRVMAATHCNLEEAIAQSRFREDLYYRLNIIDIQIPPLRKRKDEIIPLAEFFIQAHATANESALEIPGLLSSALLGYEWPGNIRELENTMRKYLVLRNASAIASELQAKRVKRAAVNGFGTPDAPAATQWLGNGEGGKHDTLSAYDSASPRLPAHRPILKNVDHAHRTAEAEAIITALNSSLWNRKQAAGALQIDYKALLYKMRKLGIGEKKMSTTT